jgi:hypothetical protein
MEGQPSQFPRRLSDHSARVGGSARLLCVSSLLQIPAGGGDLYELNDVTLSGRSRSRSPRLHRPVLPILRTEEERLVNPGGRSQFRTPFLLMATGSGAVTSIAGANFWRALVGRDRESTDGTDAFVMASASNADLDAAVDHADRRVSRIVGQRYCFYIGITESPRRRWEEHAASGHWQRMLVVVQAPDSSASAAIEMRLLAKWQEQLLCANASRGGERRSAGTPHFVYLLEGTTRGVVRRPARAE